MAAPKTVLMYPLDGSRRDFDVPFEYLSRKFVVLTLVGATRQVLTVGSEYRFATKRTITTTKAWGPGDGFESIEVRRLTSATERLVDFSDGSVLRAYDLNTAQVQSLHIAEEARDLTADTIAVNNDGDLDARGRRIVNLADATQPDHAVTLRQEQAWAASTLGNRNASEDARDAAKVSERNSKASEDRAVTAETNAKKSEDNAKASAKVATDEIAKIDGQVDAAKGHSDSAKVSADAAQSSNNAAGRYASTAGGFAGQAEASKGSAEKSAKDAADAGIQLGMSMWGYRPQPFKGFAVDDGQELDQAVYPGFVAALRAGLFPATDEATWQANPWARGHFVLDSSPGKFRMRDLNGAQPGSIGGVFQRGDNGVVTQPGNRQWRPYIFRDQLQEHRHITSERFYGDAADAWAGGVPGAENVQNPTNAHGGQSGVGPGFPIKTTGIITDKKMGAGGGAYVEPNPARHGAETYPVHVTGAWMTRLFGVITPLGAAEANSLATSYAALAGRMSTTEARVQLLMDAHRIKPNKMEVVQLSDRSFANGTLNPLTDDAFNYTFFYGIYGGTVANRTALYGLRELANMPVGTVMYLSVAPNSYIACLFEDTNTAQRRMFRTSSFGANNGFNGLWGMRDAALQ
ncbi:phage tail fiber domain-containing protein [Pseudomonas sp. GXZC]|uniref:phage tail fiber domain-containing protein n=1 Tax=Pseudomonas sp. GXZC TaxID=3003351 RepID=UPI0022AA69A9|nr:phage tail fiber protein [Pseudomonas sp. GXZC]WAT31176.1 phage tail fiber protein [Pseudomonas sp. GXZC]